MARASELEGLLAREVRRNPHLKDEKEGTRVQNPEAFGSNNLSFLSSSPPYHVLQVSAHQHTAAAAAAHADSVAAARASAANVAAALKAAEAEKTSLEAELRASGDQLREMAEKVSP